MGEGDDGSYKKGGMFQNIEMIMMIDEDSHDQFRNGRLGFVSYFLLFGSGKPLKLSQSFFA